MKTYKIIKLAVALVATVGLMFQGFSPARAAEQNPKQDTKSSIIDVSKVRVPETYGTIKEVHKGNDKVIFYLQDAHSNLEAQQNNERITEDLINQFGIDTVCEEGASGPADRIKKLAKSPNKEYIREGANYYMEKGVFSGIEHLAITGEKPFSLYGLEDKALYDQGTEAFRQTASFQKEAAAQVRELGKALGSIAQKTWSEDLKAFADKAAGYRAGKIKFTEFAQTMRDTATKQGVDLSAHKNFDFQGKSFAMESKINFDAVEDERAAIVDEVSKKLSKEDASNLVVQSLSFRLGRLNAVEYYDILKGYCEKNGVDLKTKVNLVQYMDYIKVFEQINKDALVDEANAIEMAIKDKLFTSDDQRKLDKMITHMDMVARMFDVKLGIRDYKVYVKNGSDITLASVMDFMKAQAPTQGVSIPAVDMATLANEVAGIGKFYSIATQRDEVLAKNAIAMMNDKNLNKMIMVTGGFHTAAITEQLKNAGFSVVVITPRITDFDAKSPYFEAMMGKVVPFSQLKRNQIEAETHKVDSGKAADDLGSNEEPADESGSGTEGDGTPPAGSAKAIGPTVSHGSAQSLNTRILAGTNLDLAANLPNKFEATDYAGIEFKTVTSVAGEGDYFSLIADGGMQTIAHASIAWKGARSTGDLTPVIGIPKNLLTHLTSGDNENILIKALRKDIAKAKAFLLLGYDPSKLAVNITTGVTGADVDRQAHIRRVADLMGLMAEESNDRILFGLEFFTGSDLGIKELLKMASDEETAKVVQKVTDSVEALRGMPNFDNTAADAMLAFAKKLAADVQTDIPRRILEKINKAPSGNTVAKDAVDAVAVLTPAQGQNVAKQIQDMLADQAQTGVEFTADAVNIDPANRKGPEVHFDTKNIVKVNKTEAARLKPATVAATEHGAFPGYRALFTPATAGDPAKVAEASAQLFREGMALQDLKDRDKSFAKLLDIINAADPAEKDAIFKKLQGLVVNARNFADYTTDGKGNLVSYVPKTANARHILEMLLMNDVKVVFEATDLIQSELVKLLERAHGIGAAELAALPDGKGSNLHLIGNFDVTATPGHPDGTNGILADIESSVASFLGTIPKNKVTWIAHQKDDPAQVRAIAGYAKVLVGNDLVSFDVLVSLAMQGPLSPAQVRALLIAAGATDPEATEMLRQAALGTDGVLPPIQQTKSVMQYLNSNPRSVEVAA